MRRGLTHRLMRALLGRLHGWSGAVLGRLDGPVAVVDEPAPVTGGPPAHWLERVRIQAPWFLERIGADAGESASRVEPAPVQARMARKHAVDAIRPSPRVAATVGGGVAHPRVDVADAAMTRAQPTAHRGRTHAERSGTAAIVALTATAADRTTGSTDGSDATVVVPTPSTPTRAAMPASAPAAADTRPLRIQPAFTDSARMEPELAQQPTIVRARSPDPRQVIALRVRETEPERIVRAPKQRGVDAAAVPAAVTRSVAAQATAREARHEAAPAAPRASVPTVVHAFRAAPEPTSFDIPTRAPRTAPVRAMPAPMTEPARPARSSQDELEIVWPELPSSTRAPSPSPERAMPRNTVDPWPELPSDGWEDADTDDGEVRQARVAHQRTLDHEQRGQPWNA